jgi:RES domain-containing protein
VAIRARAHGRKPAGAILFRVATETRSYSAADLSGAGAAAEPGRWNKKGESVLYTATSVALATLETAAHVNPTGLPLNKFLVQVVVPRRAWRRREVLDVNALGPTWKAVPPGATSERAGSDWLHSLRGALLLVPSVIAPEEYCVLINPTHPDAKGIRAVVLRQMEYDLLFR